MEDLDLSPFSNICRRLLFKINHRETNYGPEKKLSRSRAAHGKVMDSLDKPSSAKLQADLWPLSQALCLVGTFPEGFGGKNAKRERV